MASGKRFDEFDCLIVRGRKESFLGLEASVLTGANVNDGALSSLRYNYFVMKPLKVSYHVGHLFIDEGL